MIDGAASYRFARGEHRECRVYAKQDSGVISCREAPPVNVRFRRAIRITGLKNATVTLISEKGCECFVSTSKRADPIPLFDERFTYVDDEKYGKILKGENIDGDLYFFIGHKGTAN